MSRVCDDGHDTKWESGQNAFIGHMESDIINTSIV